MKEPVVNYTEFADLQDFSDPHPGKKHLFFEDQESFLTTELPKLMEDPEKWENIFEALTIIRILNKFHGPVLHANLAKLMPFLKDSINSYRSNIAKNVLMFCTEFFESDQND